MTNLWGPTAWYAARGSATRPAVTPSNAGGDTDDWFKDCTSPAARDGTEWRSGLLNAIIANMRSVVRKSGQVASNLDDDLLSRAIRSQVLNYVVLGGTANALSIILDPAPANWSDLVGVPLRGVVVTPNTSAGNLAIAGLAGTKPVVRNDNGAALEGGELLGIIEFIYDGTSARLMNPPRLRTPRVTVPSGGVTITAANEYTTYVMDLAVRQVFTLPAANTVPVGFAVQLETTGLPSGFQTAYANVTGGGGIVFRAQSVASFYLIGNGEAFRFISNGTTWLTQTIAQPSVVGLYRSAQTQPTNVALPTGYTDLITDTSSGQSANFQATGGSIRVPVSGDYSISGLATGFGTSASWFPLETAVLDNTLGTLLLQTSAKASVSNAYSVYPSISYVGYYPAGTLLVFAGRAQSGNASILGNATQYSVFLKGR